MKEIKDLEGFLKNIHTEEEFNNFMLDIVTNNTTSFSVFNEYYPSFIDKIKYLHAHYGEQVGDFLISSKKDIIKKAVEDNDFNIIDFYIQENIVTAQSIFRNVLRLSTGEEVIEFKEFLKELLSKYEMDIKLNADNDNALFNLITRQNREMARFLIIEKNYPITQTTEPFLKTMFKENHLAMFYEICKEKEIVSLHNRIENSLSSSKGTIKKIKV